MPTSRCKHADTTCTFFCQGVKNSLMCDRFLLCPPPPPPHPRPSPSFSTPVEERWRVKQVGARRAFRYRGERFTHQTFDPASAQTQHRLVTLPSCLRGASKPCIRTVPPFGRHHDDIHLLFQVPFFPLCLFFFFFFFLIIFVVTAVLFRVGFVCCFVTGSEVTPKSFWSGSGCSVDLVTVVVLLTSLPSSRRHCR